jgi:hypothetical protein
MTGMEWTVEEEAALLYPPALYYNEKKTWNLVCPAFSQLTFTSIRTKEALQAKYKDLNQKHKLNHEPWRMLRYLRDKQMVRTWMSVIWIKDVLCI